MTSAGASSCLIGVPQSSECEQYVECQRHFDDQRDEPETETDIYQPQGGCWENDDTAAACTEACGEKNERLRDTLRDDSLELGACE